MTNAGNGYKFKAIMENRSNVATVAIQKKGKSGKCGKAIEVKRYGNETPEQVVARFERNNGFVYRIAE